MRSAVGRRRFGATTICLVVVACVIGLCSQSEAQGIILPKDAKPLPLPSVDRSLPDLIADGYEVVSLNEGLGGSAILIRKASSVVLCTLGSYGTPTDPKVFTRCQSLSGG